MQGDISYPAWLVSGLIFADPAFPKAYGLPWGETIIGRGFDEFEEDLDQEHFKITLDEIGSGELRAILTDLGSDEGTTVNLGGIGNYFYMNQGDQYLLLNETVIEVGGRYMVFRVNPLWRKFGA